MNSNIFLNHLYKNIWKYIIKDKYFTDNWHKDKDSDYDPFDFLLDNIPELINELKKEFPLHDAYNDVIGNIEVVLRPVIMNFMSWFTRMEKLGYNGIANLLYTEGEIELKPLEDIIEVVKSSNLPKIKERNEVKNKIELILSILDKFTTASKALLKRRRGNKSFIIKNEYDVQDVLHLILSSLFLTTKREQVIAGKSKNQFLKIDFLIPSEKVGIECKYIRDMKHANKITKEINDDIQTYHKHQDCKTLIFFIYDNKMTISNPHELEKQYTITQKFGRKEMNIILKVRPKN